MMRMKLAATGILLGLALGALTAANAATTWHVATNGVDVASGGTSWDDPLATISYAIGRSSHGDTVLVSNGVYVLTAGEILVNKGVTVRSLNGRDVTVVDGNYPVTTNRCFDITHSDAVVEGFTITKGYNDGQNGGGVRTAGTVRDCLITGNYVHWYGAGVYMNGGTVVDCVISNNTSLSRGAAVNFGRGALLNSEIINNVSLGSMGGGINFWGSGIVSNCLIAGNTVASGTGAGIYMYDGNHTVWNSKIINNKGPATATVPGGIYTARGTLRLKNTLIAHNDHGGVYAASGTLLMNNCTVVTNLGRGIMLHGINAAGTIINTIAYHNTGDNTFVHAVSPSDVHWFNCCTTPEPYGDTVMNIITADPLLDAEFKPRSGSPAINAGLYQEWMDDATDQAGNPRILQGTVDIGAYEYVPISTLIMVR